MKPNNVARTFYDRGYATAAIPSEASLETLCRSRANRVGAAIRSLAPGDRLLDVGCGNGALLWGASSDFQELVGVDIARAQLNVASHVLSGRVASLAIVDLDRGGLPFASETFDAVTCLVVAEFVFSPELVIAEIARVLRKGGTAVFSIGNIVSLRNRLRVLRGHAPFTTRFQGAANGGALHHFGKREFAEILTSSGLATTAVSCSGRGYVVRRQWPQLLGDDLVFVTRRPDHAPAHASGDS